MEHLLFAGGSAPIVFPYICNEEWDGGDFHTYPQRKGWTMQPWAPWDEELDLDAAGHSFMEIAAFLQTWLFFGLLESVLGVKIPAEDFKRLEEDGKDGNRMVIATTRLKHYLDEWRRRMSRLSKADKDLQTDVIWGYISRAVFANKFLNRKMDEEDIAGSEALQESVFCQTLLEHALRRALADLLPNTNWPDLDYGFAQMLLSQRMITAGWCPYAFNFLEMELQPDAQAFIFSLSSLRTQEDHSLCKLAGFDRVGLQCVAHQTDGAAAPKTKHVTPDCDCEYLGPPTEALIEVIEQGMTPIVAIAISESTDDIDVIVYSIEITPDWEHREYFAISHVWADGMGNQEQNTLPICQIERLAEFLYTIEDTEFGRCRIPESDPEKPDCRITVAFWLDTFCIPVQPQFQEHRDRCIGQMHSIYRMPIGTIVLDPEVQLTTRDSKPVEILARLLASLWRTRLWTYQEGALAIELFLPGMNCMHEFVNITRQYSPDEDDGDDDGDDDERIEEMGLIPRHERDLAEYRVGKSLMRACHKTIRYPGARSAVKNNVEDALQLILQAMYQRSTGRPDDESICIATFAGVDPAPLLRTPPQQRMIKLLQILPCIPRSALFTWGPRQTTAGFRWAPLTFLAPHGIKDPITCLNFYSPDPAKANDCIPIPASFLHPQGLGLAVMFSGIRFTCRSEVATPKSFSVATPTGESVFLRFRDKNLDKSWEEIAPEKFADSAAVLFPWPNLRECNYALLVEMLGQQTEEGYQLCQWKCLLIAYNLDDLDLRGKRAEAAQMNRFTGEDVPYQWWVID
jgi:hypothetical protein